MLSKIWIRENFLHIWRDCKLVWPLWRSVRVFSKKLQNSLRCPTPVCVCAHDKSKSADDGETCTSMFIASLVTIPNLQNQYRCPTTDGAQESVTKKQNGSFFSCEEECGYVVRVPLEIIIVSKFNQLQKDKYHIFSVICGSRFLYRYIKSYTHRHPHKYMT